MSKEFEKLCIAKLDGIEKALVRLVNKVESI